MSIHIRIGRAALEKPEMNSYTHASAHARTHTHTLHTQTHAHAHTYTHNEFIYMNSWIMNSNKNEMSMDDGFMCKCLN